MCVDPGAGRGVWPDPGAGRGVWEQVMWLTGVLCSQLGFKAVCEGAAGDSWSSTAEMQWCLGKEQ